MQVAEPALVPVTICAAFVVGMLLALLGSIKLPLATRLRMDEARVAGLVSALFLAICPIMLISGILTDWLGVKWVLIGGCCAASVGLTGLAICHNYWTAFLSILATGVAVAGVSTASGVLMPEAFYPQNLTASLQIGNVFFGLGALATPALSHWLIRKLSYRKALCFLALAALSPVLASVVPVSFPAPARAGGLQLVLASPILWLTGLAFLLYVPLESLIATWTTTCLTDLGMREKKAALALSGFWLAFLAARLAVAFLGLHGTLPDRVDPWLVVGLALGAAMALGSLSGVIDGSSAAGRVLLIGAFLGPIFPALVAILFQTFPAHKGTAYGAMFCIGAIGNVVLPPLFGTIARQTTVQRAIRFMPVVALALAAATLVLGLWPRA